MATKRKWDVQDVHTAEIYQTVDGKWRTYVGSGRKNRKRIQSNTEQGLYDRLYEYYYEAPHVETVGKALDAYIEYKAQSDTVIEETIRQDRHRVKFWEGMLATPLAKVTSDSVLRYIKDYIKSHRPCYDYKPIRALTLFKEMTRWAVKKNMIYADPAAGIKPKEFTHLCNKVERKGEKKIYNGGQTADIEELFEQAKPDIYAYAGIISIESGMRIAEIAGLKWSDIYDTHIHVQRQQRNARGGHVDIPWTKGELNNPRGGYPIPISPKLRETLEELRAITGKGEYVIARRNGHWIAKETIDRHLTDYLRGWGYNLTGNHVFRRSRCSNVYCKNPNLSPLERATIMGHTLQTDQRYYCFEREDQIPEICDKLGY